MRLHEWSQNIVLEQMSTKSIIYEAVVSQVEAPEVMSMEATPSVPMTARSPSVGLRGPNRGSKLFTLTNNTLTVGPFRNNLNRKGYSLTRSSIGRC